MSDIKMKVENIIFGIRWLFQHTDDKERLDKKEKVKVGLNYLKVVRDNYINKNTKYKNYVNSAIKVGIKLICKIEKYELTEVYLKNTRG